MTTSTFPAYRRTPIRDACSVTLMQVFAIGICAGLVSAVVIAISQYIGLSTLDLDMFFGSFWTQNLSIQSRWVGFLFHLLISGVIAQAYAFLFRSAHRSGAGVGIAIGLLHWLLAGFGTGMAAAIHPLIPSQIVNPGLFVLGDGFGGALSYFLAHMAYGMFVGILFDRTAQLDEYPEPLHA